MLHTVYNSTHSLSIPRAERARAVIGRHLSLGLLLADTYRWDIRQSYPCHCELLLFAQKFKIVTLPFFNFVIEESFEDEMANFLFRQPAVCQFYIGIKS